MLIVHHNADPDGHFSGAIALKANPGASVLGYNYEPDFDQILTQSVGQEVVMTDVSPKKWSDMHRLCEVASRVVWIDHHPSALREMEAHNTQVLYPNFVPVFETGKWGACKKTFEYFFPGMPLPPVVEMVAAYDVFRDYGTEKWENSYFPFRFAVSHLRSPQAVLQAFRLDASDNTAHWIERGRAIAQYLDDENQAFVHTSALCHETIFTWQGRTYKVLAVNRNLFGDVFKSRDLTRYDFVVGFFAQANEWKISLRGAGKNIDLSAVAKDFGGGGHKDAAGFYVKTFSDLQRILPLR